MIKTLRIAGIVVAAGAAVAVVFLIIGFFTGGIDEETEKLLTSPGVVEEFLKSMGDRVASGGDQVPPLVQQAKSYALYLNPPPPAAPPAQERDKQSGPPRAIDVVKPVLSVKFSVLGTSFFASDPNKSFALIDDVAGGLKWVKQGEEVGHFVFEQIKDGAVVLRSGQGTQEMQAVRPVRTSLVVGEGALPSASIDTAPTLRPQIPTSMMPASMRERITGRTAPVRNVPTAPEVDDAGIKLMDEFVQKMKSMQAGTATGTSNPAQSAEETAKLMEDLMAGLKASRVSEEEAAKLDELGQQLDNKSTSRAPTASRGRRLPRQSSKVEAESSDANASEQE